MPEETGQRTGRAGRRPALLGLVGLVICLTVGLCQQDAVSVLTEWDGEPLFSIPYGSGEGHVALRIQGEQWTGGPGQLRVDRNGRFWLLDYPSARLLCLDREGQVVRTVGPRLQPGSASENRERPPEPVHLDRIETYATDSRGFVYLLGHTTWGRHLFVVDPSNALVTSDRDAYGTLVELAGEEKLLWQVRNRLGEDISSILVGKAQGLATDSADCLYIRSRAPEQPEDEGAWMATCLYKFNSALEFVGIRKGEHVGPDGFTYEYPQDITPEDTRIEVYAPDGSLARTVRLTPSDFLWPYCYATVFDSAHNAYAPASLKREHRVDVLPGLSAGIDIVVGKFGPDGRLLEKHTTPGFNVDVGYGTPPLAVDLEQRLYYVLFDTERMYVMMVQTGQGDAE